MTKKCITFFGHLKIKNCLKQFLIKQCLFTKTELFVLGNNFCQTQLF